MTVAMANYANIGEAQEVSLVHNVSAELDLKRVAAYFKKQHNTVGHGRDKKAIYVQRLPDGNYLLADGFVAVKVPMCPDLYQFLSYQGDSDVWGFYEKDFMPSEGGPNISYVWALCSGDKEGMQRLTLSRFLLESWQAKGKPGKLYRRLGTWQDGREVVRTFLDKSYMDMLTPDIDELEGFLFEQEKEHKPVRVASRSGYCAIIMPLINAGR